jgi:hypothetical protein
MKRATALMACLVLGFWLSAQDVKIGKVKFPMDFIHAGKEFKAGVYQVLLTQKETVPYFVVSTVKNERLFDEMAIVKVAQKRKSGHKLTIKKDISKDAHYYRIEVFKPDAVVMAYFMLKPVSEPAK